MSTNKPFTSAKEVCEWVRREAYYGSLPNQDGEETEETLDIIEAANNYLLYLQYGYAIRNAAESPPFDEQQT